MKVMTITDFKTHAFQIINNISKEHEGIIITKSDKPLVKIIPFCSEEKSNVSGKLKDMLINIDDIETPLGVEMWENVE